MLSNIWDTITDGVSNVGSAVGNGLETVGEYAGQGLSHAFDRLQDPEFQQQLQLFGAAMSDDNTRYQSALNSYDARRQEIAKQKREDMQRAQQREEKLADLKEGRQYSEQQDYLKGFTPESVQAFRETGDQSVLVKNPVKAEFRTAEGNDGHTYRIQIDPITGMDVEGGIREIVDYAAPKAADNGTWTIQGGYKINNKTGEMIKLDGDEGDNGTPTMRTTSGGKPIPAGYDENGNIYYQSTNANYVTDSNGMPMLAAEVGKLDPMDPTKRQALQKKVDDEEVAYLAPAKASSDMAKTAQKLLDSKNLNRAYGTIDSQTFTFRDGTADVEALRDQLSGQVFLSQRQQLKGQGQITDYESARAEASLTVATNPKSSEKAVRQALKDLIELDKAIQDRISRGVDSEGNPVRHRRPRDPLAQQSKGFDKTQVQIRRN